MNGLAAVAMVSIVGGYVVLGALFYVIVLRPGRQERRAREAAAARGQERRPAGPEDGVR